jgi:tetratricopeptide (TPR) repeat protein
MHMLGGRNKPAMDAYQSAFAIRERLLRENPTNRDAMRDMGVAHEKICGMLLATGESQRASTHCTQALEIYERLASSDRLDMQALQTVATGHLWQYRVFSALNRLGEAEQALARSTELLGKVLDLQKNNVQARRDIAYNALYASALNERMARQPNLPSRDRTQRHQRALAEYERGRDLLKALQIEDRAITGDTQLIQETRVLLGLR